MENWVIINFFIALSIGAIIGLEREIVHQKQGVKDFGGVRNFILIALFGFLLTYFSIFLLDSIAILAIGFVGFLVFISLVYFVIGMKTKRYETTSEIAALITFILASFIAFDSNPSFRLIAIIATVIVAALLAFKEKLHLFAQKIEMGDVFATIKMALISIVILPLLPNKNYTLLDIPFIGNLFIEGSKAYLFLEQLNVFNPFRIWLLVVLITGISFVGYFLVKMAGSRKGLGLTGLLGGLASSTAVTVSMSKKSKSQKNINGFALAIIVATSIMFLRILLEVLIVNRNLIGDLVLPLGIMAGVGFVFSAMLLLRKNKRGDKDKVELKNPFELHTAIKFALFFLGILVLSKAFYIFLGNTGIYIVSLISGLADVDAITLTLSSMALSGIITSKTAIFSITLAASVNTLVKAGIVWVMGEKRLAKLISILVLIILAVGLSLAFIV